MIRYGVDDDTWHAAKEEMRHICVGVAKARGTITYSELAYQLNSFNPSPRSQVFHAILRDMCREETQAGRPMLCALIVRKDSGIPGNGYFTFAPDQDSPTHDMIADWQADCQSVYAYWQTHDL